jgi:DNA mismatch repair ATPase MutS
MEDYYTKKIKECEQKINDIQQKAGTLEGSEFDALLQEMEKTNTELNNYKQALLATA